MERKKSDADDIDDLIRRMKLKATAPSPQSRVSQTNSTGAGPLRFSSSLSATAPAPDGLSRNQSTSSVNREVWRASPQLTVRQGTTAVDSPTKRVTPLESRAPLTFSKISPEQLEVVTKLTPKLAVNGYDSAFTYFS